jgi:tetratricopeptide (TPR) repeat protein
LDWQSDITLWTAAQKVCPQSFRCYQSLAYALYEQDGVANVDKMIWLDEQGLAIVDPLPDHLNSSRLYLHLGQFESIKADLLCTKNPDGSLAMTPPAREMYDKSIAVLQRGVQIDRAFNEVSRAKQILRGDKPEQIADTGYDVLYHQLAVVYARTGEFDNAISKLIYETHLGPTNSDAYFDIGNLQFAQRKYDEAAVSMLESILIDPDHPQPWQALRSLYSQLGPVAAGALTENNGRLQLNIHDPLVRDQLTSACRNLIRTFLSARIPTLADQIRQLAMQRYDLPASDFDPLFSEPPMIVTP